jgi:hypothetical protein
MGQVIRMPTGTNLSLRQLAEECGFDRDTVSKRLRNGGVAPSGKRGGHPVYRLRDALPCLFLHGEDGKKDPEQFDPFQRKAHYQAEREALELATSRRELIPRIEVEEEQARVAKTVVHALETMPDLLERDTGLTGPQLEKVEAIIDQVRDEIYSALVERDEGTGESPAPVDADSAAR